MERLQLVRTLVGFVVVGLVFLRYDGDLTKARDSSTTQILFVLIGGAVMVPLSALLFIVFARPGLRRETARQVTAPMRAMWGFSWRVTVVAVPTIVFWLVLPGMFWPLIILGTVPALMAVYWAAGYVLTASWLASRYLFNAVDGHLLMPAALAPAFAWIWTVLQSGEALDSAVPRPLAVLVVFGGPVTISVLSVWEVRRVRRRYGVTFRNPRPQLIPGPR